MKAPSPFLCFSFRAPRTPQVQGCKKKARTPNYIMGLLFRLAWSTPTARVTSTLNLGGAGGFGSKNVRGAFISTTPVCPKTFIFKMIFMRKPNLIPTQSSGVAVIGRGLSAHTVNTQWTHSEHTVNTQLTLVKLGVRAFTVLSHQHYCLMIACASLFTSVNCVLTVCWLCVHCVFTVCSLCVHCVPT